MPRPPRSPWAADAFGARVSARAAPTIPMRSRHLPNRPRDRRDELARRMGNLLGSAARMRPRPPGIRAAQPGGSVLAGDVHVARAERLGRAGALVVGVAPDAAGVVREQVDRDR